MSDVRDLIKLQNMFFELNTISDVMLNAFILCVVIQRVILLSDIMFFLHSLFIDSVMIFLMMSFNSKIDCFEKYLIWCTVSNVIMVSFIALSIVYSVCHIFSLMLNAFILSVIIQSVILLSIIMFLKYCLCLLILSSFS